MPDASTFVPDVRSTHAEDRAAQLEQEKRLQGGFIQTITDLAETQQVLPSLIRLGNRESGTFDPYFRLTPDLLKQLGDGLPTEDLSLFEDARSMQHAMLIRQQQLDLYDSQKRLERLGYAGTALKFAANVVDPVNIAAGEIAAPIAVAGKSTRLAAFVRGGLAATAANVPAEAARIIESGDVSPGDLAISFAANMSLGGVIGLHAKGRYDKAIKDFGGAINRETIANAGLELTAKGEKALGSDATDQQTWKWVTELPPEDPLAHLNNEVTPTEAPTSAIDTAYAEVDKRLSGFPEGKKLNRSELDYAFEPIGKETSNQGWPTVEQARLQAQKFKAEDVAQFGNTTPTATAENFAKPESIPTEDFAGYANTTFRPFPDEPIRSPFQSDNPDTVAQAWLAQQNELGGNVSAVEHVPESQLSPELAAAANVVRQYGGSPLFVRSTGEAKVYGGHVSGTPRVIVDVSSPQPFTQLISHELTHVLQGAANAGDASARQVLTSLETALGEDTIAAASKAYAKDFPKELPADALRREGVARAFENLVSTPSNGSIRDQAVARLLRNKFGVEQTGALEAVKNTIASAMNKVGLLKGAEYSGVLDAVDKWSTLDLKTLTPAPKVDFSVAPSQIPQPLGAAPAPGRLPREYGDLNLDGANDKYASWKRVRPFSMIASLRSSKSDVVRRLGNMLARDSLIDQGGGPTIVSASEWKHRQIGSRVAQFERQVGPIFKEWAKASGTNLLRREYGFAARNEFFDQVGRAVRAGGQHTDPHISAAARVVQQITKDTYELGNRMGIKGFDQFNSDPTYLMRVYNQSAMSQAFAAHGDQVYKLFEGAIAAQNPHLSADLVENIAKGYVYNVQRLADRTDIDKSFLLSQDKADLLKSGMTAMGLTDAQAETALRAAGLRTADGNLIPRAKPKLNLDESYTHTYVDPNGVTKSITLTDLLENNAEALVNRYVNQVVGASALAEVTRAAGNAYGKVFESPQSLLRFAKESLIARGENPAKIRNEIKKLDTLMKSVAGVPLGDNTQFATAGRWLRGLQYLRVGGQFGIAQISEAGKAMQVGGVRASLQQLPILRSIFSRAQNGQLSNELLNEIETVAGLGTERLANSVTSRFDDYGSYNQYLGISKGEHVLEAAKRGLSDVSGIAPITMAQQRMAGALAAQKMLNLADAGEALGKSRLAQLSLTESDWKAIAGQLTAHADTGTSVFGRTIRKINLDNWTDKVAAGKFVDALDKMSRQMVQRNDIGQMSQWMTTDWGKMFIQFRAFAIGAYEDQFLAELQQKDIGTVMSFLYPSVFGALTYIGQQVVNTTGQPDQAEILRKRLTPEYIGAAAFVRGGWSSIFPIAYDAAATKLGFKPEFSFARTSGLQADALFGNPTLDMLYNGPFTMSALRAPFDSNYQFSREDWDHSVRMLPLNNVSIIRNFLDRIRADLPAHSQKGEVYRP